jgi:hypothetical protein
MLIKGEKMEKEEVTKMVRKRYGDIAKGGSLIGAVSPEAAKEATDSGSGSKPSEAASCCGGNTRAVKNAGGAKTGGKKAKAVSC